MSLPRAVVFLWWASARNRLRRQLQRLRQPKYLAGAVVGVLYVYSVYLRRFSAHGLPGGMPPVGRTISEFMLTAAMLGSLLSAWMLGPDRPLLNFNETEVQQLFPAPVSRGDLLRYKFARGALSATVAAFFSTVFIGRVLSPHPVLFFLGAVVSLTTVNLHITGASFMRTRLLRHGRWGTVLRWVLLTAVSALLVGAVFSELDEHPFPERLRDVQQIQEWGEALMDSPALWPGRLLVQLPLAQEGWAFMKALPLALGLLALHYVWVMRAAVPFEEAAVNWAEERARMKAQLARPGGRPTRIRTGAPPFRLQPLGRPEVAILWKNLIAGRRTGGAARLVMAGLLGGLIATLASGKGLSEVLTHLRVLMAPLCGGLAVLLCLFGPTGMRVDLRMDLPRLELLRAMPLTGRQVVAAELAGPALLLGGAQVGLLLMAMALALWEGGSERELWLTGGLSALCVLPAVTLGGLFVQNAAVVLFPAWLPPEGERVRGIEALGQRLLTLAGTLVVLLVGLVPAAFVAAVVGFGLYQLLDLGWWALPFAGLTAAAVLGLEVALGVGALGHAFDQLDVSMEDIGTQ